MILILTQLHDRTADAVCTRLSERGAEFTRFDPAEYPERASLTVAFSSAGLARLELERAGERVDLRNLSAVWLRRPSLPVVAQHFGVRTKEYVEQECRELLRALYDLIDSRWVPGPPNVVERAQLKLWQLQLAAELGLTLPETVVTNRPQELKAFHERQPRLISKLAGATAFQRTLGRDFARYTEPVSTHDLLHMQSLRHCPVTFQEAIDKALEVRVTVVDGRIFAAEIHSQETIRTRQDWRRYDHAATRYARHVLPNGVAAACLALVTRCGLVYGAIDLILTPSGEYVFLELNPAGEYGWIEERTGLEVTEAVCDLLTRESQQARFTA
ncbi:MAG TPA: hypothetical protein VHW01_14425 [Polyangiaceae bacterium]|nr:hypothetical protein [Polyangiaceae bacterium]